jgi:RNA polymerase sigma factor (sigma-70 family)
MREFYNKLTKSLGQLVYGENCREKAPLEDKDWYSFTVISTRAKLMLSLSRMLSPEESEEVIQEVYLKLFLVTKTQKLDNPVAYVYRLARNLAISRLRSQTVACRYIFDVSEQLDSVQPCNDPQAFCTEEEDKSLLLDAINTLPPICRQVFVLRKLHGQSHKEIAEDLGISIKTVENHIYKGMQHCHHYLTRSHYNPQIESAKKLA